jgi:UDP-N-acetylglucosamine 2-epimerase (non-hydrolysing)
MSIVVVVGTRPEIIKMAPIVKELEKRGMEFTFIHSGQHYDYEMSQVFPNQTRASNLKTATQLLRWEK